MLATAVLPKPTAQVRGGQAPAAAVAPKFLIAQLGISPLDVRDAATGALVATVRMPTEPGSQAPTANAAADGRTYIDSVATADGYHYFVSLVRLSHCRSWLYQFQLNAQGQPSAVRPFAALPTVAAEVGSLTVSGDGRMIAFNSSACTGSPPQPFYLGVTDIQTGQTKRWSTPAGGNLSLTADGTMLYYNINLQSGASAVFALPTSAAPGHAADYSRTVLRAPALGFVAISPDGRILYFTTFTEEPDGPGPGQVRALNLATGRSRLVYAPVGRPGLVTADPAVQNLLLQTSNPKTALIRLNLATGHVTDLPSGWLDPLAGLILTW